jgi:hypothetical protein
LFLTLPVFVFISDVFGTQIENAIASRASLAGTGHETYVLFAAILVTSFLIASGIVLFGESYVRRGERKDRMGIHPDFGKAS